MSRLTRRAVLQVADKLALRHCGRCSALLVTFQRYLGTESASKFIKYAPVGIIASGMHSIKGDDERGSGMTSTQPAPKLTANPIRTPTDRFSYIRGWQ